MKIFVAGETPAPSMTGVRIDKWLWAARFYKTRSLAGKACELGRVTSHNQTVKPAREVHVGDILTVHNETGDFVIEVLGLSEVRGPASVAQALYRESDESKAARQKAAEQHRLLRDFTPAPATRPSKRDRRRIIKFRGE
jgi:ribosome-associated heat shock protein Hsp15